ncbi:MAG: ClpX C4-type zinc finger protein, partial [Lachnospiraceae bacterium]|nr:ClpX C4-type zinc finger protein [Lachnospiraceae bacterium]
MSEDQDKKCMICHRSENETGKLITMPGGIAICPECMQKTFDSLNGAGFGGYHMPKPGTDRTAEPEVTDADNTEVIDQNDGDTGEGEKKPEGKPAGDGVEFARFPNIGMINLGSLGNIGNLGDIFGMGQPLQGRAKKAKKE